MAGVFDLSNTFGALFIGLLLSTALWGITSTQAYVYVRKFPNDNTVLRFFVCLVWLIDTLQQALISHAVWHFLIDSYFTPFALFFSIWSLDTMILLTSLMSLIVQTYFGIRVHQISRGNWLLSGSIVTLALATFSLGAVLTARALILEAFAAAQRETKLVAAHISCAVLCDLLITGSLTWYLHRARTGFKKTDTVIDKLLVATVNRGLLTCLFAIAELICFIEMPNNMVYLGLHFIVGKLYAISWLGALNARRALHGQAQASERTSEATQLSTFRTTYQPSAIPITVNSPQTVHMGTKKISHSSPTTFLEDEREIDESMQKASYLEANSPHSPYSHDHGVTPIGHAFNPPEGW